MPYWFAAIAAFFSLFSNYVSLNSILLNGCVGYLLGMVLQLKKTQREQSTELEKLWDQLQDRPSASQPKEQPATAPIPQPPKRAPSHIENFEQPAPVPAVRETSAPREEIVHAPSRPLLPAWFTHFFTTGNLFAKAGAILLFFGVSFLIKLVADQGLFPLEFRLLASGAVAITLMALGWRLRHKNATYALILQGTGFGVFYLTVFGSFRIWDLLPAGLAFALVVGATVLFSFLSVIQNSLALAVLAVAGGFSAPVLISTGSGNHVALFSYYALLNLGVLAIAKFRPWRELNLIGFLFTYGVGALWGAEFYQPEFFWTVEPFLVFHFFLYVIVSLYFSELQVKLNKDFFVDATLVFGVPIATFFLQSRLVSDTRYGLAITAAALGAFYVGLATTLFKRRKESTLLMVESFLAAGICFTVLAVPFAVNNAWTSAAWALEGAFLTWFSIRQNRPIARYFGMGMQILASIAFFTNAFPTDSVVAVANAWFIGSIVIFASCLFVAFQLFKKASKVSVFESKLVGAFLLVGIFWWVFALCTETQRVVMNYYADSITNLTPAQFLHIHEFVYHLKLLFLGASFAIFYWVSRLIAWPLFAFTGYGLFGVFLYSLPLSEQFMRGRITEDTPFANTFYLSMVVLSLSALLISRSLYRSAQRLPAHQKSASTVFLLIGFIWWVLGNRIEIGTAMSRIYADLAASTGLLFLGQNFFMIFLAFSALAFSAIARRLEWPPLASFRLGLGAFGMLYFLEMSLGAPKATLLTQWGLLAWPSLVGAAWWLLRQAEIKQNVAVSRYQHLSLFYLVSALLIRESYLLAETHIDPQSIWRWVSFLGCAGMLAFLPLAAPDRLWPFGVHRKLYLRWGITPHLWLLIIGSQFLNFTNPGKSDPLPFLPVLNPLSILILFSLVVLVYGYLKLSKLSDARKNPTTFWAFVTALVLASLSMGLVRTISHYAGIPWDIDTLLESRLLQAALTIYWGLLSLSAMIFANRKGWRGLWIAGSVLAVVVVIKLFLFDLQGRNTMERVVSFLGSGVLLLLIGYFAPLPTKENAVTDTKGKHE